MSPFAYQRQQRLLNASDYTQVFDNVDAKISHQYYLILARRPSDQSTARLGLIAAKKHLRKAVQRNAFKRIVRESFRHHQQPLNGIHLIVMARAGALQATPAELRKALDQAWPRLCKRLTSLQTETPAQSDGKP